MSLPDISGAPLVEYSNLDIAEFYRNNWRRRPVVWRGCAHQFLATPLDWVEVETLDAELAGGGGGDTDVRRSPDGTIQFFNQAQHALPRLARVCAGIAARFGWETCTADISVTRGPGAGIGCHFDFNDNIVVQQHGAKRWQVGLPEHTAPARQRARMLEIEGFVPRSRLPEHPFEVDLRAGDVLYLPLFAPHQGVDSTSGGGSISVSFSYNSENALQRYIKPLLRQLSRNKAWWGPIPLDGPEEAELTEALRQALAEVLSARQEGAQAVPSRPDHPTV